MGRIPGWKIKYRSKTGKAVVYEPVKNRYLGEVLVAELKIGGWNVEPETDIFPEKSFKTKQLALKYAAQQMSRHK